MTSSNLGKLTSRKPFDYDDPESDRVYDVTISVKSRQPINGSDVIAFDSCDVIITIRDVNDNYPVFEHLNENRLGVSPFCSFFNLHINENVFGASGLFIRADDVDSGNNGDVIYSLKASE